MPPILTWTEQREIAEHIRELLRRPVRPKGFDVDEVVSIRQVLAWEGARDSAPDPPAAPFTADDMAEVDADPRNHGTVPYRRKRRGP